MASIAETRRPRAPLVAASLRPLALSIGVLYLAACASSSSSGGAETATTPAPAAAPAPAPAPASQADPRVGLGGGLLDADEAMWNLRLVSKTPAPGPFFGVTNSDLAFKGKYVIQGNYNGFQVWDISNPAAPELVTGYVCPASQSDVSVYQNLLFVSGEGLSGRLDCGTQGVQEPVSKDRLRGIRIFDISDIANPKYIANVQTCRGSHTHTVVTDPDDTENVYIYVSGSAGVRSPEELPGCSDLSPQEDPNSSLFRIEVIRVPLANPEQAAIVSSPRIFEGLVEPPSHGEMPQDVAAASKRAAAARAAGAYTAEVNGLEIVLPTQFVAPLLDSVVKARQGTAGTPTAADSAALREAMPSIVAKLVGEAPAGSGSGPRPGPTQCHDITVYPAIGLAGGACEGYGLLLDISDVTNPTRLDAAADSNFAYWHSATFNNDGTKLLFSDEWGGGGGPKCRATDKPEWGADAIFTVADGDLNFESYYKMPAAQTVTENCVAHNGSLIPVPGRDIMVQSWYQGGVSVFDWTDPANPKEIAFFDRGPIDTTRLTTGGSWSAYWYNGYIVSSEIARGLDILELTPSPMLTQNEIDAAKSVQLDYFNAQHQPKLVWPPSFAVARAYLDQLERSNGLSTDRVEEVRDALAEAEEASGDDRREALTELASTLDEGAASAADPEKVRALAEAVSDLADAES